MSRNIIDPTKLKEIEEALVAREGMCIIEEDLRPDAYDFAFYVNFTTLLSRYH